MLEGFSSTTTIRIAEGSPNDIDSPEARKRPGHDVRFYNPVTQHEENLSHSYSL